MKNQIEFAADHRCWIRAERCSGLWTNSLDRQHPISFKTASGVLDAGEYRVVPVSADGSVMKLQNVDTGHVATTGMGRMEIPTRRVRSFSSSAAVRAVARWWQ